MSVRTNAQKSKEMLDYLESKRSVLMDPEAYVKLWAVESNVIFTTNGQNNMLVNGTRVYKTLEAMFDFLWLDYERAVREYKEQAGVNIRLMGIAIAVIKESTMLKAFNQLHRSSIETQKAQAVAALAYNNTASIGLEHWLKALTGEVKATDLAIMKHFLWSIKRRMAGIYPPYLKVPVVYGAKQQTGKSTAIRKLLAPINLFKLDRRVSEILDERNTKALGEFYVCFLDEMAGMQRAETETLKHVITADYLTYRPMRTNQNETVFVTCSFIGASNKPLRELVSDTTGQARFWEIQAVDDIDHTLINSIDYLSIWQSIDENLTEGYIKEVLPEITKLQQEETAIDYLQAFLKEHNYNYSPNNNRLIAAKVVYQAYQEYCIEVGERPLSLHWLGRRIKKYGLQLVHKDGKNGYLVNPEFLRNKQPLTAEETKQWSQ